MGLSYALLAFVAFFSITSDALNQILNFFCVRHKKFAKNVTVPQDSFKEPVKITETNPEQNQEQQVFTEIWNSFSIDLRFFN
jgi:hypothetical protein